LSLQVEFGTRKGRLHQELRQVFSRRGRSLPSFLIEQRRQGGIEHLLSVPEMAVGDLGLL
jgi:hypothetical protein